MAADRFVLKQFAGSAINNGAFGAAQAVGVGVQPVADIKDVQSLSAFEQGWNAATLTSDKLPALEEMQGLEALLCKALKENYSEGIPFWIAGETYFQYSFVNYNGVLYYNTTGSYTNINPAIDTSNWAAYDNVGTATVGTDDTPIYLNVGTPTAGKRMGVVAYDNTKTYNLDDVVLNVDSSGTVVLYLSLVANNTSALTDTTKWRQVSLGGGADIGDIGFAPLGIDESLNLRRYLNGQVISQDLSPAFTNKVKAAITLHPSLGTTEANWQSEKNLSKLGQCGKFVIDDENHTIRLPAVVNAQGLLSLSGIGNLVNESLPNITGISGDRTLNGTSGAFYQTSGSIGNYNSTTTADAVVGFDASLSSSTYQTDAPVQQEAIQYPYYIQVATGVEEILPAIREYEINTPFFFGKSMYSENPPYNASWLASNGQYNASSVYPDLWTQLTGVELNSSLNVGDTIEISGKTYVKRGLPVVLSTGTITDYDFIVNQNDQTFRLPLLNGEEALPSDRYIDLTLGTSGSQFTAPANGKLCLVKASAAVGQYIAIVKGSYRAGDTAGVTSETLTVEIDMSKGETATVSYSVSGSTTLYRFVYSKGNGTLYYYVGDTVQDASLINAGAVLNTLSNKVGYDELTPVHAVVETYQNGESWYRVYDDGWVEQGGLSSTVSVPASGQVSTTINLLKPMASTQYTGGILGGANSRFCTANVTLATTTITVSYWNYYSAALNANSFWYACGQGASS